MKVAYNLLRSSDKACALIEMVITPSLAPTAPDIASLVRSAVVSRAPLLDTLHAEQTDCYRLFHGAVEGLPGCTLDRYGDLLLWQTFRPHPVPADTLLPLLHEVVADELGLSLQAHWTDRRRGARMKQQAGSTAELPPDHMGQELGLRYRIEVPPHGRDPLLYLDFRAARRWLAANSAGKDVLNAFSFTCGAGVSALAGGASSVTNLDFSEAALATGRLNAASNGLSTGFDTVCADALPALRLFADLPLVQDRRRGSGRGGRAGGRARGRAGRGAAGGGGGGGGAKQLPPIKPRQFDVCVLDPPTWATSSFGAVDLVRDYQALFKPCVLATRPGGTVLACNHVSTVALDEWVDTLERCAKKAGRPLAGIEVISPEVDFPSPDGRHPLKMVLARLEE